MFIVHGSDIVWRQGDRDVFQHVPFASRRLPLGEFLNCTVCLGLLRSLFYEIARSWGESTHSVQGTSDESTSSGRPSSTWIASMLRAILSFSIRSILFFSFTLFFDAWFGFDIDQLDKKSPDFDVVLHRCVVRKDDSACSTE